MLLNLLLFQGCGGTEVKVGTYNTPPNATIVSPPDGSEVNEGEVVDFEAIVDDSSDPSELLEVFWSSDLQGDLPSGAVPSADGTLVYSTANLEPGTHVISLTVLDSSAASSQASIMLTIIDLPEEPEIYIINPIAGDEIVEGELFLFQAQVADARDEVADIRVTIESDFDGVICSDIVPTSTGNAVCSASLNHYPDQHLLTFTATNTAGYQASATTYFGVTSLNDIDNDFDGFTENQGDCDDTDPQTYIGAATLDSLSLCMTDFDGDGYGDDSPLTGVSPGTDCDDAVSLINPGATESENNLDDDCDGLIDDNTNAYDDDGDGFSENQGDCDDTSFYTGPDSIEVCGDTIDNNCNGTENELGAYNCTTYYRDADSDGFGDPNFSECWCLPGGSDGSFVETNGDDCYDGNNNANPNQTGYFAADRGDGSFDYNCDYSQELLYNNVGYCAGWSWGCDLAASGWEGSPQQCGQTGNYFFNDDNCDCNTLCVGCNDDPGTLQQTCR